MKYLPKSLTRLEIDLYNNDLEDIDIQKFKDDLKALPNLSFI